MKSRRAVTSLTANPVLIGAVTLLVVTVAVFLAYNANAGLPFVPTFEFKVEAPDAGRLVPTNEVREGGLRIGQVSEIRPVRVDGRRVGAQLTLRLDKSAAPIPADSTILIRPRSTLGLKYVELIRGDSRDTLVQGATISAFEESIPPELDDFFDTFDAPTRRNSRINLTTFGGAFAGRGRDLNRTFAALPELLRDIQPVMRSLSAEGTQLARFFDELEDAARISAPVADDVAQGFTEAGRVFEAISRDPEALKATISESPPTLDVGIRSLADQRPFLRRLAGISDEIRGTAREARRSLPAFNRTLAVGTPVLRRTPQLNQDLRRSLAALRDLSRSPTTNMVLGGLTATMRTLNPTLRWVGPHVTVCNYWNYWWTYLSDHLSEEDSTGTAQRIQAKNSPLQDNTLNEFGASQPVNGEGADPVSQATFGDPAELHAQSYGRAVDERGEADCESGQRGYPRRLAQGAPANLDIVVDPRTPGNQGPTFTGRPRVPEGQTFSAEPNGLAPKVGPPAGAGE